MSSRASRLRKPDFGDQCLEYGFGVGAGVELIKHVQVAVRYFWNMGSTQDAKINVNDVKDIVTNKKANGVMASVALLF